MVAPTEPVTSVPALSLATPIDSQLLARLAVDTSVQAPPDRIGTWIAALNAQQITTLRDAGAMAFDDSMWSTAVPIEETALSVALREVVIRATEQDARDEAAKGKPVSQLDIILVDVSRSMKSKSHVDRLKTREDLSKVVFHALMDGLLCLEESTALPWFASGSALQRRCHTMRKRRQ